jgi:hypothetical protein
LTDKIIRKCKECVNYNKKILTVGSIGNRFNEDGKPTVIINYQWGLCEIKYTNAEGLQDSQFVSPNHFPCKDFSWHKVS